MCTHLLPANLQQLTQYVFIALGLVLVIILVDMGGASLLRANPDLVIKPDLQSLIHVGVRFQSAKREKNTPIRVVTDDWHLADCKCNDPNDLQLGHIIHVCTLVDKYCGSGW